MGRDSRFKSDVLGGYYFTCALTGYRLDTETTSIVQAAHIHQHAVTPFITCFRFTGPMFEPYGRFAM